MVLQLQQLMKAQGKSKMAHIKIELNYYGFEVITGLVNTRDQAETFIAAFDGTTLPDDVWNKVCETGSDYYYSDQVLISISMGE